MNRLRYKDGKGDPRGFKAFLDKKKLPLGIIPRYRGNRLNIVFHIFIEHYDSFVEFFKLSGGPSLGGLRSAVCTDFGSETAKTEFVVLGLLGKHLTGPWMKNFYTSATSEVHHIDGIDIVKCVLSKIKAMQPTESQL